MAVIRINEQTVFFLNYVFNNNSCQKRYKFSNNSFHCV